MEESLKMLLFACFVLSLAHQAYTLAIDTEIELERQVKEAENKLLVDIADALLEEDFLER